MFYIITLVLLFLLWKLARYVGSLNNFFIRFMHILTVGFIGGCYFSIFDSGTPGFFITNLIPDYSGNEGVRVFSLVVIFIMLFTCFPKRE